MLRVRSIPYPWIVVFLTLLAQLASALPFLGVPTMYPFIQEDLGLSRAQIGLVTSCLMGGGVVTAFLGGLITDSLGVRRVATFLLILLGILMIGFPFVGSYSVLLLLAVFVGMCEGPAAPSQIRGLMDWVSAQTRGFAMSLQQTGVPIAGTIVAAVLPGVTLAYGWRMGAICLSVAIFVIAVIFLIFYRDGPRQVLDKAPRLSANTLWILVSDRALLWAALWVGVFGALFFIIVTYVLLFLIEIQGINPVLAGAYLAFAHVASIIARVSWGAMSDFLFGHRRIPVLGIIGFLTALGLFGMALIGSASPRWLALMLTVLLGLTALSWPGVFAAFVGELVGASKTGMAIGAISTVSRVCQITLTPLFGLMVDMHGTYVLAWGGSAVIAGVCTLLLVLFGTEPRHRSLYR